MARFERFRVVILDFKGVEEIGQAFADEVFRVFQDSHPNVKLIPVNTTREIKKLIRRVKSYNSKLPLFSNDK